MRNLINSQLETVARDLCFAKIKDLGKRSKLLARRFSLTVPFEIDDQKSFMARQKYSVLEQEILLNPH